MRADPSRRRAAVFSPARRFGGVRPPIIGALAVVIALIGLFIWLALADSSDRPAEGDDGTRVHLSLKNEEAPSDVSEAPPSEGQMPEGSGTTETAGQAVGNVTEAVVKAPIVVGPPLASVDPALLQPSSQGPLPIIGADDRRPWQVYAKPFQGGEGTPRLAIVIAELGFNRETTEAAMRLPAEVTLSFSPYAPNVADLVAQARQAGHEVMLDLPMEPTTYPADDPGPETLLVASSAVENVQRLEKVLGRAQGYVGVISYMGSRFTTAPDSLRPVLGMLAERGVLFVDGKTSATSIAATIAEQLRLPRALNDRFVDNEATRLSIDEGLAALESDALRAGTALGVGRPYPVTLQRLADWLPTLVARGIALAPVSAVVDRQKTR